MGGDNLYSLAYDFACRLSSVLNRTITNNVVIKAVVERGSDGSQIPVGQGITTSDLTPTIIPLRLRNETPTAWLDMIYQMRMDGQGRYLMVQSSYIAIYADLAGEMKLCHFDYEREKEHGYPEAHLQVYSASPALEAICQASGRGVDSLAKLHFPVGGRRFRPCLEDVIEFLIVERLARGRDGWEQVVKDGRDEFQANQLKAAMRGNPDIVKEFLAEYGQELGWQRSLPDQRRGSAPEPKAP